MKVAGGGKVQRGNMEAKLRDARWVERAPLDFCSSKTAAVVRLGLTQLTRRPTEPASP